ncbi:MAG: hypothetical protein QOH61_125 [Chloroflexota bacterium]|nr:hypothetical protein [Chloroflexota bacterium]
MGAEDREQPPPSRRRKKSASARFNGAVGNATKSLQTLNGLVVAVGLVIASIVGIGVTVKSCLPAGGTAATASPTQLAVATPPLGGPTPTAAGASAAAGSTPTGAPTSVPTPTRPVTVVTSPVLHWLSKLQGGSVLDGGAIVTGTDVWLHELYPAGVRPSTFAVLSIPDPSLGDLVTGIPPVVTFATQDDAVEGAISDHSWTVKPPSSSGTLVYRFQDDLGNRSGTLTVASLAAMTIEMPTGQVVPQTRPGLAVAGAGLRARSAPAGFAGFAAESTVTPVVHLPVGGEVAIPVDVHFAVDASLTAALVVPWGSERESLPDYARQYLFDLTQGNEKAVQDGLSRLQELHRDSLPGGQPEGWDIGLDRQEVRGRAGQTVRITVVGTLRAPASSLMAVMLTDPSDPTRVAVSSLFQIDVVAEPLPAVRIDQPAADGEEVAFTDYDRDRGQWYADVTLAGTATAADGEPVGGDSLFWTTDQTTLQEPVLGSGEKIVVRLYAPLCSPGVSHAITLTATDRTGTSASATRTVVLPQAPC